MLFIDDHHAESSKLYCVLDDGMRAYENLYVAREQTVEYLLSFLSFHDAREQFYPNWHIL